MKLTFGAWLVPSVFGFAALACGGASGDGSSDAGGASSGGFEAGSGGFTAATGGSASGGQAASGGAGTGGAAASGGSSSGGAAATGGATGTGGAPADEIPKMKAVMYLPNWAGSFTSWSTKIDFDKMTHLNLAFGTIKGGTNDWSMGASDADVKAIVAAAHAKNVKVLVSIGGADDDIGIINRYHTESNIAPMVANLSSLVDRLGLDGVDVDVERGSEMKSSGNFGEFVSQLEDTMHGNGKLVTAALAQYILEEAGDDAGVNAWVQSFDFINLMIYVTKFSTYQNEATWWTGQRDVPAEKLTLGVEFTDNFSTTFVQQVTTYSKDYGGIMAWELSMSKAPTLWAAIQDDL
jgi:hypothetical protein